MRRRHAPLDLGKRCRAHRLIACIDGAVVIQRHRLLEPMAVAGHLLGQDANQLLRYGLIVQLVADALNHQPEDLVKLRATHLVAVRQRQIDEEGVQ